MFGVPLYTALCNDFSTNGLGLLLPLECYVEEQVNGKYEATLVHVITDDYRWAQVQKGMLIKCTCPARESPLYETVGVSTQSSTVTRSIYKVKTNGGRLRLRQKPNASSKILSLWKPGTEVIKLADATGNWYQVSIRNGGQTGYMYAGYLQFVRNITETIEAAKPTGSAGVQVQISRDQLFRIYAIQNDTESGLQTLHAMHVFYDLRTDATNEKYEPDNEAAATAVARIMTHRIDANDDFTLYADRLTGTVKGEYDHCSPIKAWLDPDDGMLTQAKGLLFRDNFDIFMLPDETRDMGVTIRRGKNLVGVTVDSDDADVVTRIIPCGKDKKGDPLYLDGTIYVDSSRINDYFRPHTKKIEYDVRVVDKDADNVTTFTSIPAARARLRALANEDFNAGCDLATYGMDVNFVILSEREAADYPEWVHLQAVHMNDTVTVIDEMIGLRAKVRVTGYKWDVLLEQYEDLMLGEIQTLKETVYGFELPAAGVSGTKIAPGTADGAILRNLSLQYAKISTAAIQQLAADAITAVTAYIGSITAETIETDQLSANMAEIFRLLVNKITADAITAETIETDTLMASLAEMVSVSARYGDFNFATVQHLVASAMNIQQAAVAGRVFIENLDVAYAQMVDATISNLVVKSSEGDYYRLDVSTDGSVTATQVTVSPEEREAGHTTGGRAILDTDIAAVNLSTANLLATYALVNQIDAARIDVAQLFAQDAFIRHLNTTDISSNTTVQIVTRIAQDASAAAAEAQDQADAATLIANALENQLKLWFTFDSDLGFIVQKMDENGQPVSIWSTVTDEVGYHIRRADLEEYVFSAYRDRVRVQKLEIGDIMIKASSAGGHVWTRR